MSSAGDMLKRDRLPLAVVVSHGSGVNGLGIVRSLARRGIATRLVAKRNSDNLVAHSRFCGGVHWLPDETPDALLAVLGPLAASADTPPVLFFDSDEAMHLARPLVDRIRSNFILTNSLALIPKLQNKEHQTSAATAAGIPVPRSWYLSNWNDLRQIEPAPGRRLIIKPNPSCFTASAPFKVLFARDAADVRSQLEKYVTTPCGMIVQDFVEGHDEHMWVVSGYRPFNGGPVPIVTMAKTKQSGSGAGGVGVIVRSSDCPPLREVTPLLLKQLNYYGAFAVEFKYSEAERKFFFIEANFRTARIHVLGRRIGADLPAIIYADLIRQPEIAAPLHQVVGEVWYYDMLGCLAAMRITPDACVRRQMIGHILRAPLRQTEWAVHAWDDWKPSFAAFRRFAQQIAGSTGRRLRRALGVNVTATGSTG